METRKTRPTAKAISKLEEGELYWLAVEPIWKKVSIYRGPGVFLKQFAAVNSAQGLLFAAHWCQSEVCNGGLHQFFSNSTGVLAPEAVRGLEFIRIPKAARIVARAMAMLGSPYPRDREERSDILEKLARPGELRSEWDPFNEMDKEFYKGQGLVILRLRPISSFGTTSTSSFSDGARRRS